MTHMKDDGSDGRRPPPFAHLVGRRPKQGAVGAAKVVVDDVKALVRAEIALAKAEMADGVKAKVMGAGFFIGVAIIGWFAIQVFLVLLGFLFALFLPGWAAVLLVLVLMLLAMGALGYLGVRKMKADGLGLETTKAEVERDKAATSAAVEEAKTHMREGTEEAKAAIADAAQDVRHRLEERRNGNAGRIPTAAPPAPSAHPPITPSMRTPRHPAPSSTRPPDAPPPVTPPPTTPPPATPEGPQA